MTAAPTAALPTAPAPGGAPGSAPRAMSAQELIAQLGQNFYSRELLRANSEAFRRSLPANRQVLIAAMPKTGSTLLVAAVARLMGRAHNLCTYASDGNEEELYFPTLVRDTVLRATVCKLHVRATAPNLELMRAFGITPIVQTRNLFDVVVSFRDHFVRGLGDGGTEPRLATYLDSLSEEAQYDYVIDTLLPWSVAFFATWWDADQQSAVKLHWLDYDNLNADKVGTIAAALRFLGQPAEDAQVAATIDALSGPQTRKNQGVSGRGQRLLTEAQRERVVRLTRHYPWVDFSRVGVGA